MLRIAFLSFDQCYEQKLRVITNHLKENKAHSDAEASVTAENFLSKLVGVLSPLSQLEMTATIAASMHNIHEHGLHIHDVEQLMSIACRSQ